ncbi:cobalamin-5'-phosphate synthase [Tissierella praeacuta DSM 18095]|uniref:Adenosylcobinamide-GDP ribazoletransferase n=2 Tax=Tissierella praeacuta TaxID=43131 RepID=A0A1M4WVT3_9FIRM|nr:adenosylcobinamide-GDP ribazoletransferase [Tissierella praeacuta]SHE85336.1 cobalamin-5'-phosphate synthase [Tissierella praeacuta DSM 18095]SUP00418.1 cobalamin synthase [Tissierella praeacuta]
MLWHTSENQMIKGFILSLQFFSHIPININVDFGGKNIKYSIFFLPLVGAIIGALGGLVYYLIYPYNNLIASFLGLLTTIIATGGLHLDGLSDTFDGFLSNRDKEKTLEIMKDSRIGAFGVLSLILLIMFKFILIYSIKNLPLAIVLSFANSRLVVARIIAYKKNARPGGLGDLFHQSNPKILMIISGIIYIIILLLLDIRYIIPLLINFLAGEYISYIAYKKIGGFTGDVYGAVIELGDTISLLGFWGVMLWI